MGRPKITFSDEFEFYRIQNGRYGSRCDILRAIILNMLYMYRNNHHRLCVCHFTVHIPPEWSDQANSHLSHMLQSWRRTLNNNRIDAEYLWVREKGDCASNGHPHFHIFTILPGRQFQYAKSIANRFNALLSRRLGQTIRLVHVNPPASDNFCWGKKVSEKLNNFGDTIHWISYIAKIRTKEAPPHHRTFGCSKGYLNGISDELTPNVVEVFRLLCGEYRDDEFDDATLLMSDEEWKAWGYGLNPAEFVDFDPATGGSYVKKP